jgi:glycerol kinase
VGAQTGEEAAMNYILALDQGTTSSRAILFDREGRIRSVAQREFGQIFPQPGWVEHDAYEIWDTQLAVARDAIAKAGCQAADIAAIGITNQRETTVVWERKSGAPIHHAIVWQDRRTAAHCDRLRAEGHADLFQKKTGLVLDAYFSGTKIAWLLDNVPGARARAENGELAFGTIDTWLAWKLSAGRLHVTDISNASRTLLCNISTGDWDDELLKLLDVPRAMLPNITRSAAVAGDTEAVWFGAALPIAGIAGDQQAALFGQACHTQGMAKNTYGTGCFMLMHTGGKAVPSHSGLLTTAAAQSGKSLQYALEGSVFIGGAVVQWLRDGLGVIKSSVDVETLAASVPDAGGVYLVPAFAGLGAPHWDPYARGSLFGLTRGSTAAHIARAALEAIAFQSADLIGAMQQDSGIALSELRVDGGASANNLLMQFQADLLGVPVVRPKILETTALGAAYLAGLATGFWKSTEEIARQWAVDRTFEPAMNADRVATITASWRRAVERSKHWEQP